MKKPLVLCPGLLCDDALYAHQIAALDDVADILVADLTVDETLPAMARRLLATAPASFALAGLSMGGYLAQEIMRQAPERVLRLALLATSARADDAEQSRRRRDLMDLTRRGRFRGVSPQLLPLLVHPDRLGDTELTGAIVAMAERVGGEAFLRQQQAIMARPDGRGDLAAIACPTLVIGGRDDRLVPIAVQTEIADHIPGADLVVLGGCGHMVTMERPQTVSALLRDWLSGSP